MKAKEFLKEITLKSENQLKTMVGQFRTELQDMKFKVSQNQLKEVRKMRVLKKNIARVLSAMKAKKETVK